MTAEDRNGKAKTPEPALNRQLETWGLSCSEWASARVLMLRWQKSRSLSESCRGLGLSLKVYCRGTVRGIVLAEDKRS